MRIVIDAGHGKNTTGKRCLKTIDKNETREWVLNNIIATRLQKALQAYDCEVLRVDDVTGTTDVSLSTRVTVANNFKADVYLSIHHNAGVNGGKGGGIMVYWYSSKPEREQQAKSLYNYLIEETGLKGNRATPVQKYEYYVLKKTNAPAFLIENGFMDSTTDTPVILSDKHGVKTVNAIVKFLEDNFKLKKKVVYKDYEAIGKQVEKALQDIENLDSVKQLKTLLK